MKNYVKSIHFKSARNAGEVNQSMTNLSNVTYLTLFVSNNALILIYIYKYVMHVNY